MRSVVPMKIAKYGYIIISVVFCLVGLTMILLPTPSVTVIGYFFGIAMMVFGIIKLIGYFSKDLFRLAFQYDLQFGILLLILGGITLLKPENTMTFICISLGVCIIADCLFKMNIAFEAKSFGIRSWWLILTLSIFAGIIGLLLVFRPSAAIQTIIILLGISLLAEGILNFSVAINLVKIIKNQVPDVIETDYYEIREEK